MQTTHINMHTHSVTTGQYQWYEEVLVARQLQALASSQRSTELRGARQRGLKSSQSLQPLGRLHSPQNGSGKGLKASLAAMVTPRQTPAANITCIAIFSLGCFSLIAQQQVPLVLSFYFRTWWKTWLTRRCYWVTFYLRESVCERVHSCVSLCEHLYWLFSF